MQHIEQQPYKTMLRVLEERITTAVSLRSPVPTRPHVPTFTGSWTFELTYPQQGDRASSAAFSPEEETLIQLKITEQGVVKKPLVRLSNLLLFGFHRRIDRFMKDLERCLEQSSTSKDKVQLQAGESTADDHPIETPDTTDDHTTPTMTSSTVNDTLVASQSASAFLSPRSLDKDWDLVSEIYERQT
ncbi:hypothetical protein DM01DRAFT_1338081 [Hesseltinella vesiculosa]|uniref:Uncharacterized protein n=1 Tax=Hesseltinella vesiculosa TaxID=101127 RepID=A0A1X2GBU7_9FUNG|nr:hypothetical protein DM01DRAFT_1338081 [Hesseltinella vesiculosa]